MTAMPADAASNPVRVSWIQEAGKDVLFLDLSHSTAEQSLGAIKDFERAVEGKPKGSVLLLLDLTKSHYSPQVVSRWKSTLKAARLAHMKAAVSYGYSGLMGVTVRSYREALRLLGLSSAEGTFKTRAEALAWLLKQ